jgi:DivIVA domain-containing protein
MELHKRRGGLVGGVTLLVVVALVLLCLPIDGPVSAVLAVVLGVGGAVAGGVLIFRAARPFQFRIGPDGLTLRGKGGTRMVPWADVEAVILDQPAPGPGNDRPSPRLLLAAAAGADIGLPMTASSPAYDGGCAVLLGLDDVVESPDQVAEALTRYAGHRFVNALTSSADGPAGPDFTFVLRGYDPAAVDEVIRAGRAALSSPPGDQRRVTAAGKIRDAGFPTVLRGYDRWQVDEFLDGLAAELSASASDQDDSGTRT